MPKVFLTDIDRGFEDLKKSVRDGGMRVKIGVQGTDALKAKKFRTGTGEISSDIETTIVSVATFHEFGVDSGKIKIPERSFLRATIDQNKKKYQDILTAGLKSFVNQKLTKKQILSLLGQRVQSDIVKRINSGISPSNSEATIKKKGSSKPLIDTGQLKQSITYIVVEEGKK